MEILKFFMWTFSCYIRFPIRKYIFLEILNVVLSSHFQDGVAPKIKMNVILEAMSLPMVHSHLLFWNKRLQVILVTFLKINFLSLDFPNPLFIS